MRESMFFMSGWLPMGWPNCTRSEAYWIAVESEASAMPIPWAATPSRAVFISVSMALKPLPFVPTRKASASSKRMAAVGEPWMPSLCSRRSTESPFFLPSGRVRGHR
jgi:hypothetical protein